MYRPQSARGQSDLVVAELEGRTPTVVSRPSARSVTPLHAMPEFQIGYKKTYHNGLFGTTVATQESPLQHVDNTTSGGVGTVVGGTGTSSAPSGTPAEGAGAQPHSPETAQPLPAQATGASTASSAPSVVTSMLQKVSQWASPGPVQSGTTTHIVEVQGHNLAAKHIRQTDSRGDAMESHAIYTGTGAADEVLAAMKAVR